MLYVYYGDAIKARAKTRITIANMLKKNPEALSLRVTDENFNDFDLPQLVEAQALFKNTYIVLLDNLLAQAETREQILNFIKEIALSANIFFILEESVDEKTLKKLERHAGKVQEITSGQKESSPVRVEKFNTFALADAFGAGDKKKLWTLFWKAKNAGVADEEIYGVLFWVVKVMLLANLASSADSAGLKPFVFEKWKRLSKPERESRLFSDLEALTALPHDCRREGTPLTTGIEKFILSV